MKAGLRKIRKTVRGKHGAVTRSYWVKTQDAAKRTLSTVGAHKGAIAGSAMALMAAAVAAKHRQNIAGHAIAAAHSANKWRRYGGASLTEKLVTNVGGKIVEHLAGRLAGHYGAKAGAAIGRRVGGRKGRRMGEELGAAIGTSVGETVGEHATAGAIKRAGRSAAGFMRKKNPLKRGR
ncbi:MAG: hypothetical protein E6R03_06150 [Hyphomicrobiaceae bacterium]|nr:MAG: hypothetical protein E6R03_06150 [Hyphomicrobiaceae bacterium]